MPANARQVVVAEYAVDAGIVLKTQAEHNVALAEVAIRLAGGTSPVRVCGEGAALLRAEIAHGDVSPANVNFVEQAATSKFIASHARRLLEAFETAGAADETALNDLSPIYAAPSSAEINFGTIVTS